MRRGLLVAVVTALVASAVPSPALAQEAARKIPGEEEYCAGPAATASQYDCEGPQTPECAPQQQYAEDETGGCVVDPDQYGTCTASTPCGSEAHSQINQDDANGSGVLPPASVQNVVVGAARSVTKDAPKASRALDTAQLEDPADKVALAAEVEPIAEPPANQPPAEHPPAEPPQTPEETVEEPPAYMRKAPEEAVVDGATVPPAAEAPYSTATVQAANEGAEPSKVPPAAEAPYSTATPTDTAEAAETTGIAELAEVTEPAETTEPPEVVDEQEKQRGLEEADGEPVASYGLAPVDQFMVPLFALGGSTLLVAGGLLVRRIVG